MKDFCREETLNASNLAFIQLELKTKIYTIKIACTM